MSGRIRSVKPEWLDDELLASCSSDARMLSVALLLMADDYGNGRGSIATIAGEAWRFQMAADDGAHVVSVLERARGAMAELEAAKFITLYTVDRQRYFCIRNWAKHQKVDKPGKPRVPGPPDSPEKVLVDVAKAPDEPAKIPDVVATDRDLERDHDQDPRPGPGAVRTPAQIEDSAKVMGLARPSMPRLALVQAMAAKYSERVLSLTGKHWAGPSVIEAIGRGAPPLANRNAAEHLDSLAAWAESDEDPLALFVRVLDGAAADEWVASKGLPLKSLAENPARWVSAIKAASKDGPQPPSDASKFRPMSREERRARMTGGAS